MKNVIPFSKEIIFKSNIAEISSISLESNYEIDNNVLKGNFVVTGEYKSHELSINKEDFKYNLPFDIELDENIDVNTIKMAIEDFTYDFHDDVLVVKIEYSISGDRIKEETEREIIIPDLVEMENPDDLINIEEAEDEMDIKEEVVDNVEEVELPVLRNDEDKNENDNIEEENVIEEKSEYVTYHVHVVKEEETIESICKMYEVNMSLVEDYNDIKNIKPNDKIIIPIYQDE